MFIYNFFICIDIINMLSVSNTLPISNFSQVVISDNAGSKFAPKTNSRIRLQLPPSLSMVDFHSSYLKFDLQVKQSTFGTTNTFKMKLGNDQGSSQIIRDLRILMDGRPVEEITHYNVLDKVCKDFSNDTSLNVFHSQFDHALVKGNNPNYFVRSYDATGATPTALNEIGTGNTFQPRLSGVLSLPVGVPLVATGLMEIELILEDSENVLVVDGELDASLADFTADATGGYTGEITLSPEQNIAPFFKGKGWETAVDCPFHKGNVIKVVATDQTTVPTPVPVVMYLTVLDVAQNGNTIDISVVIPAGTLTNGAVYGGGSYVDAVFGGETASANTTTYTKSTNPYTYEVNNVEYVCRSIEMPPNYTDSLQKRIQGEGLVLDIPTYSMYLDNIQPNINKQSILVPCYSSRAKCSLSIPVDANQAPYAYNRGGSIDGLRQYQFKIGARVEPQRPIDVSNTTLNDRAYASQEHLQEFSKALVATGLGNRSLLKHRDNFVMGRSLSAMGGTEDLTEKALRVEIEYNSGAGNGAKNVFTFVNHIRRLQITPSGLQIYG
tara:strand:+ start:899 stop:2554 length:1656 start_codon:yes stop_codon:yes gene_type:complete